MYRREIRALEKNSRVSNYYFLGGGGLEYHFLFTFDLMDIAFTLCF